MQNEKLGVGKPREFDQSTHSLIKMLQRKIRGFHLRVFGFGYSAKWKTRSGKASERHSLRFSSFEFSVLGIVQNGKLGVEKPRKDILRGFRVFDLTSESMLNAKKENED